MIEAVTFDLWHTLLYLAPPDEERYIQRQLELGGRALSPPGPLDGARERARRAFQVAYTEAVESAAQGVSVPPAAQVERAGRALGWRSDPEQYLRDLAALVATSPFRLASGVAETLDRLRGEGYALGVISNTVGEPGRFLAPICERLGISERVDQFVWSDEQPWTKPAPEIFWSCLRGLECVPAHAVHVGDGISDLRGARAAGYRAAILYRGLHEYAATYRALFLPGESTDPSADFAVDALPEIPAIVRAIAAEPAPAERAGYSSPM